MATNLSLQLTSFVGRERQIAELEQLLHSVRLLTLVGSGGVGKTRLAQRVASDAIAHTPDGVWLVELARLTDASLVVQTVAATLDIREQVGEPLERSLQASLADRELLLVLDNCEHLVAACAALVDGLLRTCPRLRVVATSREPLGVVGETTWRVPSLQVPDLHSSTSADEINASEAVRLFVDRVRSGLPSFAVTDRNARSIAQICTQLDGIPLALELAAARISTLGVEQLLSRLDDRFRLLVRTGPSGAGVLERHRTLRATLEWSHDLLSEPERRLLRRLSIFAGGWSLEAAESVCADTETLPAEDILDLLARLADRSMVLVEDQDSSARYGLLETVRQYAHERLELAGEVELLRNRHRDWYLAFAQKAEANLNGPAQSQWIRLLEREQDNVRLALRWSIETGATDVAQAIATALAYFWEIRGHLYRAEARHWLSEALRDAPTDVAPELRARALNWAGMLASEQYDFADAERYFQENQRLCLALGDRRGVAAALLGLGQMASLRGEYGPAGVLLGDSLAISRELEDRSSMAVALRTLAATARAEGEPRRAVELATESLACCRGVGDSHQAGHVLDHIGEACCDMGELERATQAHAEAMELLGAAGCEEGVNTSFYRQARLARARGDTAHAIELVITSLRGFLALGHGRDLAANLELLAELTVDSRPRRSAHLLAAAEVAREAMCSVVPPAERAAHREAVAAARRALGDDAFAQAWQDGRDAPRDRSIELAIACGQSMPRTAPKSPLTPRETEVARLVHRGKSNREIAEELVVSVRTAEPHITNVLTKLGLHSRAQLAVWVLEHGLLNDEQARTMS